MKLDALFFGSHPDDIELTCGGTAAKLVKMNKKVGITDLSLGELSTRGNVNLRQMEAKEANKVLGITVRENLKLQDGNLENSHKNRLKIIKIIRYYTPEIIFLPYPKDRHPDHINAGILVKEAAFFSGIEKIKTRKNSLVQRPHKPGKLIYYMHFYTFEPSFIIDISKEFDKKMEAIMCYKSQFYNPDNKSEPVTFISGKKFIEYIEARAKFYGFQIGVQYGEPFFIEDKLKLNPDYLFEI